MEWVGKYQILGEIGAGGFGRLYRAHDATIPRDVALKFLKQADDPESLIRFQREAAALGRLQHRNIVTVYDSGVHENQPYLVMELLDGQDLADRITAGLLPLWEAMDVMQQVAAGLQYAHEHGVMHRDVTPGNIRLLPNGIVKLIDFGMAGEIERPQDGTSSRPGGTYLYRAPEQFGKGRPDHRADIFVYGVILYQLVTGVHPFAGDGAEIVGCHIKMDEPAPVLALTPECPPELAVIIAGLLVKDPELRYQRLKDVLVDMQPVLTKLKGEQAAALVEQARELRESGQLQTAIDLLGTALELDSQDQGARELRRSLLAEIRRQRVREKSAAALADARRCLEKRLFNEAVEYLEEARRSDANNEELGAFLQEVRAQWELRRRVVGLLRQSEESLAAGKWEQARQRAEEAAQLDAGEPEAQRLAGVAQREIERLAELRLQSGLELVRTLSQNAQFDQAYTKLSELAQEWPAEVRVAAAVGEIQALRRRHERLADAMSSARQLQRNGEHERAIGLLSDVAREFPDATEVQQLLADEVATVEAQMRSVIVTTTSIDVQKHAAFGEYEEALSILETVLQFYPGEETCMRLVAAITRAREQGKIATPCRKCGTRLARGAKFCDVCGTRSA